MTPTPLCRPIGCGCCRRPWTQVEAHVTVYDVAAIGPTRGHSGLAAFPLCEGCYAKVGTVDRRLTFYAADGYTKDQLGAIRTALELEATPLVPA